MNLVGVSVNHRKFGKGVVKARDGNYIEVEFGNKNVKFAYPSSFEKFLKADDAEIQAAIEEDIKVFLAEEEQKELVRKEVRKAEADAKEVRGWIEKFGPDYHAEKLSRKQVLTYQQVEERFGIKIYGPGRGIVSTANAVVLFSTIKKYDSRFLYHDKWTIEGDYIYSGEGKSGDQTATKGNLAIMNAAKEGKKMHLFVKFSEKEYYYQGVFELADYMYEDSFDETGKLRKEYKFRLRKAMTNENV